ncbi:MAG: nucleotide exchange factor GrpE [Verrucomicrobium sp.]|nr:nucleotide exchange factor GrpE [Verrucomicrobium sp.]
MKEEITGENPAYIVVSSALAKSWQEKATEAQDKAVRTLAEWDNSRKRMAREKEDAIRFANEGLLETLLPVVDNFELGMMAASQAQDAKAIAVGLQMVLGQIQNFLKDSGLEAIDAVGKPFDPHQHEAIGHEPSDQPEGTVISQRRKGYSLKGKLLRPALVVVSQGVPEKKGKKAEASAK